MSKIAVKLFNNMNNDEKEKIMINCVISDSIFFQKTPENLDFSSGDLSKEDIEIKENLILKNFEKGIENGFLSEEILKDSMNKVLFSSMVFSDLLRFFLFKKNLSNFDYLMTNDSVIIDGIAIYPIKMEKAKEVFNDKIIFRLNKKNINLLYKKDDTEKLLTTISLGDNEWKEKSYLNISKPLNKIIIQNKDLFNCYFEETAKKTIKKIKKSFKINKEINFSITDSITYKSLHSNKIPVVLIIGAESLDISDIEEPVKISNYNFKIKSWLEKQNIKESLLEDVESISLKKRI